MSSQPESVSEAKKGAYALKAGSSLPEERVEKVAGGQVAILRYRDELYAVTLDELRLGLPKLAAECASKPGTIDLRNKVEVRAAFTRSAVPEFIRSVGSNNIVRYDGQFYVVPQSLGEVHWGEEDLSRRAGITIVATSKEAAAIAAADPAFANSPVRTGESSGRAQRSSASVPRLLKAIGTYNIVEFEDWFYGLPHSLGSIDLQTVDVVEMPGVIRDVSLDVVEGEIQQALRKTR